MSLRSTSEASGLYVLMVQLLFFHFGHFFYIRAQESAFILDFREEMTNATTGGACFLRAASNKLIRTQ